VSDLVDKAATKSDAAQSKPAPDIVAAALQKAKCNPSDCVMLGDTPYDVKSAKHAGVAVIALRCGGTSDGELVDADEIYDDPTDLLAHLKTSRFFG
ncbi:MAG: HAD-IA family hydrolase, partial [Candidatus Eremiobacteraeota bacterium]|nr:HAD-IA family hydrolase [Candidatus Eremiobacteraeota bacterium]